MAAVCVLILAPSFLLPAARQTSTDAADSGIDELRDPPLQTAAAQAPAATAPRCEITEESEIIIICEYSAMLSQTAGPSDEPKIVLSRAFLSFKTTDESHMRVELTFTNAGTARVSAARSVYLAIDDDSGRNHVRRVLPHVDLQKLMPGEPSTFSDRLLTPAFQSGHYVVKLWIPDPSKMFNPERNWLLSTKGVPDRTTGLNIVAKFMVAR